MSRVSWFFESIEKHTSKTLCKAKSTENSVIVQFIRCGSTDGFSQDHTTTNILQDIK